MFGKMPGVVEAAQPVFLCRQAELVSRRLLVRMETVLALGA